jgi:diaminopimelate epimerase
VALRFTKMHGLGNDYVYVSLFDQTVDDAPALARVVSDRHRGIGSDGLILIAPPDVPDADVRMIMYNADGSRSQMCGNGIRCVAKYTWDHGLARSNPLRVSTDRGVLTLDLMLDSAGRVATVRVDMGEPILAPERIPVGLSGPQVIQAPLTAAGQRFSVTCVSMGNPHAVIYVPDLGGVRLAEWGPALENHALFPQRINVHFVRVVRNDYVEMVTWERGSGPTQACGTGASAVCVAGVLEDRTGRAITARLPGGELQLVWVAETGHVLMTGPATEVFAGEWPDDATAR